MAASRYRRHGAGRPANTAQRNPRSIPIFPFTTTYTFSTSTSTTGDPTTTDLTPGQSTSVPFSSTDSVAPDAVASAEETSVALILSTSLTLSGTTIQITSAGQTEPSSSVITPTAASTSIETTVATPFPYTYPTTTPETTSTMTTSYLTSSIAITSVTSTSVRVSSYPASSATDTPLPDPEGRHHTGMSPGIVAAAVIVPILILLLLIFILYQRRTHQQSHHVFLPMAMTREKSSNRRATIPPVLAAHIVTSRTNDAYFTGLDTFSPTGSSGIEAVAAVDEDITTAPRRSEGGTDIDPPPPYILYTNNAEATMAAAQTQLNNRSSDWRPPSSLSVVPTPQLDIPQLNEPGSFSSPFSDPGSPISPISPSHEAQSATLLSPISQASGLGGSDRPGISRANTSHSITSTLYSDTASVHSARAARLSTGGLMWLGQLPPSNIADGSSEHESGRDLDEFNPFTDDAGLSDSPLSRR